MRKYLFIDDDGNLLRAIQRGLSECGNVFFAECHSVNEALAAIRKHLPDVIFLDHHLTDRGEEGFAIADQVQGITIYTTTTNDDAVAVYKQRGIASVSKRSTLAEFRSIINQSSATQ